MTKTVTRAIMLATVFLVSPTLQAQIAEPAKVADTSKGKLLVDAKDMTLYTLDRDASGKSNCNGQCAQNWPPLKADAGAKASGNWMAVARDDGSKQ